VDQGRSGGAPWTHDDADRGHGGALTGAWPPAVPVHGSSPAGAQQREREKRGELGSGLTGARAALRWLGDGGAEREGGGAR
jgi:hypothetical protein